MIPVSRIDSFLRKHDMPRTKFGRLVAHDPRLVDDMRNGRVPRPAMAKKLEHFMNNYAPVAPEIQHG